MSLCKRLTVEAGVTLIPISAFYASDQRPHHLVRYALSAKKVWALGADDVVMQGRTQGRVGVCALGVLAF